LAQCWMFSQVGNSFNCTIIPKKDTRVKNSKEYQLRPPVKSPRRLDQWFSLANQSSREWLAEEEEEEAAAAFFWWDFQSFWMLVRPRRSFAFELSNLRRPCVCVCVFFFFFG
jgi:hypothetical protein